MRIRIRTPLLAESALLPIAVLMLDAVSRELDCFWPACRTDDRILVILNLKSLCSVIPDRRGSTFFFFNSVPLLFGSILQMSKTFLKVHPNQSAVVLA